MSRLLVLVAALALPGPALAQISHGGTPPSLDPEMASLLDVTVPVVVMPYVDVPALQAEDEANAGRKDIPWRFGQPIEVALDMDSAGQWEALPGGDQVWRLRIQAPGAVSLNLAYDRFELPPGAKLFVRSADGSTVLGAFTEANNKADGQFATDLVPGDETILEYVEPAKAAFPGDLSIAIVTHGYRKFADMARGLNDSGACNHNVHCPPMTTGWEDQVRSVVMLVSGNSGFCSGALVNNTLNDGTPYFLTANHCYSNPSQWVMWFNWESPDCNNPNQSPAHDSITGASLVARDNSSDFALLELSSDPPANYDVYYSGWDHSGDTPQEATCIHHPSGDIKKFTVEGNQIWPDGQSFWGVGPWDEGTTEGGSSGAPLYDQNHRIVGQLYGGSAACNGSNPNNGTDTYGAFDASWDGSQPDERLRDWLDPQGSGPDAIDGYDPNTPLTDDDAGILLISNPVGVYCASPVPAEVTLKNYGSHALTAVDIRYRVDGGNWSTMAWTGNLATGATAAVTLPDISAGGGSHDFEAETQDPNGVTDQNTANDGQSSTFEIAAGTGLSLPLLQGFEATGFPPSSWSIENPDGDVEWERTTLAGGWDASNASAWFDNYDEEHPGEEDVLFTPMLDLTTAKAPVVMEFDVAYARYNNQYYDELQVRVSDDCGQTWSTEYDKQGSSLATANDVENEFVPGPSQWRTETVDLSAFGGEPSVLIAFVNISGWGQYLYVDNINIHGGSSPDDQDGDGYTVADGDCDDSDPDVHPNHPEDCADGVDNDCDGDVDGADDDCAGDDDTGDDDGGDDDGGDDDTGDDDGGDDDGGDDDGGDDDGGDDDGGDDDTGDDPAIIAGQDCACRTDGSTAAPAWAGLGLLAGLLVLGARRR